MEKEGKIFPDYLSEWHQQYGPVFKFQMLDKIIVSIIDPNGIKVLLEAIKLNNIQAFIIIRPYVFIKEALVVKNFPKSGFFFDSLAWPMNLR